MVECPWCNSGVILDDTVCPVCRHEVLLNQDGNVKLEQSMDDYDVEQASLNEIIYSRFKCPKCKCTDCEINEVAMTGTGLSKLFDIQHNHYLFVSCLQCASVEVINPNILERNNRGSLSTILDLIF